MTLRSYLELHCYTPWTSPAGPNGADWTEAYIGLAMIPHEHAPGLKNPIKTKIPTAQDGFKKGASPLEKKQAHEDLAILYERMRRQIGKPEVAHTAQMPLFPNTLQWY